MSALAVEPSTSAFIKHSPRPHQSAAVAALLDAIGSGGRAQAIHPCGSGKTRTGAMFAEAVGARVVLVCLPSLALVAQTMPEWNEQFEGLAEFRAVCSDTNVTPKDEKHAGQGRVLATPEQIAYYLAGPQTGRVRVLFTTYQSSPKVAAAMSLASDFGWRAFDLAICDEAHRLTGERSRAYSTVLYDEHIPADRRLFLTATPKHVDPERPHAGLVGMDDEALFGKVAHRYSFAQATADGVLSPYKVTLLGVNPADMPDFNFDDAEDPQVRHALGLVATLRVMHTTRARRMVTFHSTKERAEQFSEDLLTMNARDIRSAHVPDLQALAIHSDMSAFRRASIMGMLAPSMPYPIVVSNPRVLTEGVDVPALDGVVFVDPRRSMVDIVQAIGRALRVAPGKSVGHIVIPVLMNPDDSPAEATRRAGFDMAWQVLAHLREFDDALDAWLSVRATSGTLGALPKGIEFDFGSTVTGDDAARLAQVAQVRMVNAANGTQMETVLVMCDCREGCELVMDRVTISD